MAKLRLFADETGNFDFSRGRDATRYFGVGTLVMEDDAAKALTSDLQALRYLLTESGAIDVRPFHAAKDKQAVRDEVFKVLMRHTFRFDVTLLEKSKALPRIRDSDHYFFKHSWFYHFKYIAAGLRRDDLIVIAAELGLKAQRQLFRAAIDDVITQCLPGQRHHIAFWPSTSECGLQAVDYCLWAVFKKYERGDTRSYDIIKSKIRSEFDLFRSGTRHFY